MKGQTHYQSGAVIRVEDEICHPAFFWPETLLKEHITFEDFPASQLSALTLTETGVPVPFQIENPVISGNRLINCDLYFLAGLQSGQVREFILATGNHAVRPLMEKSETADTIRLSNGKFTIILPKSQSAAGQIPAPICAIEQAGRRMGNHTITAKKAQITLTEEIFGALFCRYRLCYAFNGGGKYIATVQFTYGYDFVELTEEMDGIAAPLCYTYRWDNFSATHQYMSTWPDHHWDRNSPRYGDYTWKEVGQDKLHCYYGENPRFQGGAGGNVDSVGVDGEGIRLAPYAPFFAYSIRPCGAYWDAVTGQSVGIFVNGAHRWDDREYAVWASGNKLAGKYYYENDTVVWRLPIADGCRSLCISCYNREKDEAWFAQLAALKKTMTDMGVADDIAEKLTAFPGSYTGFLHNRYVTLHLDTVRKYILRYDGAVPEDIPFADTSFETAVQLYQAVISSGRVALATKGTEEFHDRPYTFEAVEVRMMYDTLCDGYIRLHKDLTPRQKQTVDALLLLTCYICAGEEAIPMATVLGGHPNFLTDIKCAAALGAVLFPQHPDAGLFADTFEKFVRLNTRYHTRPAVSAWQAEGGRWTEAIGIYTWAFLGPAALTDALLRKHYDGKARFTGRQLLDISRWILGLVSAPIYLDGRLTRVLSTQGAHSALRQTPRVFQLIAQGLENYAPLLADNIYAATADSEDFVPEANHKHIKWSYLYSPVGVHAKPNYKSIKYTGYGMIMRYAPNTDHEVSVHLQQIDEGPNYRWGMANDGGCGSIFYYADNKCYSYNGKEDAGDRRAEDASYSTGFAVWTEHGYRAIGQNVLSYPLLALGEVQYSRIDANPSTGYSYPAYRYRSVLMMGGDYIVIYDHVGHESVFTRFSWFVRKEDELPSIHFTKGITMDRFAIKNYAFSQHHTPQSKGVWYEGSGDCMAIVSHRQDLSVTATPYGGVVTTSHTIDYIVNGITPQAIDAPFYFRGNVGSVRVGADFITLSVIEGSAVGYGGFTAQCSHSALCLTKEKSGRVSGTIHCHAADIFTLTGATGAIYVDYTPVTGAIALSPGEHMIEVTDGDMTPGRPEITGVCGNTLQYTPSAGAQTHIIEASTDGITFTPTENVFSLTRKAIIRIKGVNGSRESEYSPEYPYFPITAPPPPPAGVCHVKGTITWGEVYGATGYRLYGKTSADTTPTLLYSGMEHSFVHHTTVETVYFVTAQNQFGEGIPSFPCDNVNPVLNQYPASYFQPFSRYYTYLKPPYYIGPMPEEHYPE